MLRKSDIKTGKEDRQWEKNKNKKKKNWCVMELYDVGFNRRNQEAS